MQGNYSDTTLCQQDGEGQRRLGHWIKRQPLFRGLVDHLDDPGYASIDFLKLSRAEIHTILELSQQTFSSPTEICTPWFKKLDVVLRSGSFVLRQSGFEFCIPTQSSCDLGGVCSFIRSTNT